MLDEGTITVDTVGGSVSIREMGRFASLTRGLGTFCALSQWQRRADSTASWESGAATRCHPQDHRHVFVSRFDGFYVLEDVTAMKACVAEENEEVCRAAGDELLTLSDFFQ